MRIRRAVLESGSIRRGICQLVLGVREPEGGVITQAYRRKSCAALPVPSCQVDTWLVTDEEIEDIMMEPEYWEETEMDLSARPQVVLQLRYSRSPVGRLR